MFFTGYFIYLHFKCYPLSPLGTPIPFLLSLLLWGCSLTQTPTNSCLPTLASTYTGTSSLPRTKAYPPTDARQDHPLLHMQLETWVAPCEIFGWWFSPWELCGGLVVWYCCSSYGIENPLSSFSPFFNSSIGDPVQSDLWLQASPSIRLWQSISGSYYIRFLLASTSTRASEFGVCIWDPQVEQSLEGFSFSLYSTLCLHISSCENFSPLLRRTEAYTLWSSFFLSFMWSVNCILGIPSFWSNIHLSVSEYHVCSFMIGLLHSGRYFLVPSICLRISWVHCF